MIEHSVASSGESVGENSNALDQLNAELIQSPKRQYLIAPRIGRTNWPANIQLVTRDVGPSLENSMKPSLLVMVNNPRRFIGPRSSGLLPQARIGRRAAPLSGLVPQPRVGRSDGGAELMSHSGDQEIPMSTINDSSMSDVIETILSG